MSFDQLIHEYLDTGLDDARQEALFAEISKNSEVRNEFNTQMKLQALAREDMSSIVPPTFVTKNVFGKLGFTPPLSHGAVDKVSKFSLLKNGWIIAGITAFLTFSLSYLIIPTFNSNRQVATKSNVDQILSNKENTAVAPIASKEVISTSNSDQNISSEYISSSNQINSGIIDRNESNTSNSNGLDNSSFIQSLNNEFKSNYNMNSFLSDLVGSIQEGLSEVNLNIASNSEGKEETETVNLSMNNGVSETPVPKVNTLTNSITNSTFDINNSNWSVNWRFIKSSSSLVSNIPNSSNPLLNNSLGIYYKLSKGHYLALEFGLEQVDQSYFETITVNRINVSQRPESFWYSLAYKYRSSDLSFYESIYPFIQLNAGASQFGPMARSQVGFEVIPIANSPLLLYASYEASNFWYFAGNNSFDTFNKGFSFGFSYNF